MIALHKMNMFHWHLTDDNGWRIEIKRYPLLTEKSAWRIDRTNEPWKSQSPPKENEKPTYGGYYTQDEIREVVEYAAERNEKKYGYYTPGSRIKIISEKLSRLLGPEYYLVLPWHFKDHIIKREKRLLRKGIKLIFPLPQIEII